jgi:hypothetical protein
VDGNPIVLNPLFIEPLSILIVKETYITRHLYYSILYEAEILYRIIYFNRLWALPFQLKITKEETSYFPFDFDLLIL